MRLTLDLSPMLVNRTAAFHICRVVIDALAEHQPGLQYLGEAVTTPPEGDEIKRLKGKLEAMLVLAAEGDEIKRLKGKLEAMLVLAAEADRPLIMPPSPARGPYDRCVFLDPLYVLFSDLSGGDMVLIHDLSPVTTPGWHRPEVARLYELALAKIAKAAPQLLAVSANSAETYHANYGYPRRPIRVVPLFVPDHVHPGGGVLKTSRAYFLFVGSLEARKNVLGAIEAFRLSGLASKGYALLLVGGHGHDAEAVLRAGGATPGVIFHGFVEDAEIAGVYEGATGFVYPSYLEGFGVPLLEALMHGVPAVASITGACSEVGGDLVAYCNPDDHLAIARELQRIASMTVAERAAFAVRARRRVAEHFSLAAFTANICDAVLAA